MTSLLDLLGDQTLRVIDVGARGAPVPRFKPVMTQTEVIGFELDAEECRRLNAQLEDSAWKSAYILPHAVGEDATNRTLYITRSPNLTSLLEPNTAVLTRDPWRVEQTPQIDTVSLDELQRQGKLHAQTDFLKLDTQGSELEILKSGEGTQLHGLLGLEVEAEFRELYLNQPRFSEVELFLRDRAFELVHIDKHYFNVRTEWTMARKSTSSCDAVFLRGAGWVNQVDTNEYEGSLRRLLVLYLLYGLFAEAYALAQQTIPTLGADITNIYTTVQRLPRWRWRLSLVKNAVLCAVSPTPQNRVRLATAARKVVSTDGLRWMIEP